MDWKEVKEIEQICKSGGKNFKEVMNYLLIKFFQSLSDEEAIILSGAAYYYFNKRKIKLHEEVGYFLDSRNHEQMKNFACYMANKCTEKGIPIDKIINFLTESVRREKEDDWILYNTQSLPPTIQVTFEKKDPVSIIMYQFNGDFEKLRLLLLEYFSREDMLLLIESLENKDVKEKLFEAIREAFLLSE